MDTKKAGIAANYFRGVEAVGGKIYFDEKGLTFQPHKFNIQREVLRIAFSQMRAAESRKTYGIIPNGMVIYTKDDKKHKFVVYHPKELVEYIRSKISCNP